MDKKELAIRSQQESIIKITDTVTIDGLVYRVIDMDENVVVLVRIETTDFKPRKFTLSAIINGINEGALSINPFALSVYVADDDNPIFKRRKAIINDVLTLTHNRIVDFRIRPNEAIVQELLKKHGLKSKTSLYNFIGIYIKGGFDYNALMPRPRKERNTEISRVKNCGVKKANGEEGFILKEEDRKYFDEAIKIYKQHKLSEKYTLEEAYSYLIRNHYSKMKYDPETNQPVGKVWKKYGERPSWGQFINYYYSKNNAFDRLSTKFSKKDIRNDLRLLPGTSLMYAKHPGALVEIDACEIDLSLVGMTDRGNSLGRPTMYMMVDVFTRLILAVSVGFKKNCKEALIKLFVNLAEDKVKLCKRYGIILNSPDLWPSCIIPELIRTDRGSDFKSKGFMEICSNIDMILQLVPGATGSFKGWIEHIYNEYGLSVDSCVAGIGLITKEYGSRHHEQAVLNIIECYRIALIFTLYHNNLIMTQYPLTKEMEEANIKPSPVELWKYGIEQFGSPVPILNKTEYLDNLRLRETVKLRNGGFIFKGVKYYPDDVFELQEIMSKTKRRGYPIDIYYDPSDISKVIYFNSNHQRFEIKQNLRLPDQQGFDGYDFNMWKAFKGKQSARMSVLQDEKREKKGEMDEQIRGITSAAVAQSPTYASTKNMQSNRRKETEMDQYRGSITEAQEKLKNDKVTNEPPVFTADLDNTIPIDNETTDIIVYKQESTLQENNTKDEKKKEGENVAYSKEKHLESIMRLL